MLSLLSSECYGLAEQRNTQKVKEILATKSVQSRVNLLTYIYGMSLTLHEGNSLESERDVNSHFDYVHGINLRNALKTLRDNGSIFPIEVVFNNVRAIYKARFRINNYDMLRYATENEATIIAWLTRQDYIENSDTIIHDTIKVAQDSILTIYDKGCRLDLLRDSVSFCKLMDEAINTQSANGQGDNIPLHIWRCILNSYRVIPYNLKCGLTEDMEYTPIGSETSFVQFAITALRKADNTVDKSAETDFKEAFNTLKLIDLDNITILLKENPGNIRRDIFTTKKEIEDSDYDGIDHLNANMTKAILAFHDEYAQLEQQLYNENSLGLESYREVIERILELFEAHRGVVLGSIIAFILGMAGWVLHKKLRDKGEFATKTAAELDTLRAELDKHSSKPSMTELKIVQHSKVKKAEFVTFYNTELDDQILSAASGYNFEGLTATLNMHVDAIKECQLDINHMLELLCELGGMLSNTHGCTDHIRRIKETYYKHNFHLLPHSLEPLYNFVESHGGHKPFTHNNPGYAVLNTKTVFTPTEGDKFWIGSYSPQTAISSVVKAYSNTDVKVPVKHDNVERIQQVFNHMSKHVVDLTALSNKGKGLQNESKLCTAEITRVQKTLDSLDDSNREICWPEHSTAQYMDISPVEAVKALIRGALFSRRLTSITHIANSMTDIQKAIVRISMITTRWNEILKMELSEEKEYLRTLKDQGYI